MPAANIMSRDQYMACLEKLGLPIVGATKLGASRRSAQRFASGATSVPGPLAVLMRLMIKRGITVEQLEKEGLDEVL